MKNQTTNYFNDWLTLMEQAFENLTLDQFRELEDRIKYEIEHSRKELRND